MSARATPSEWESDVLKVKVGVISSGKTPAVDAIRAENRGLFDVVFVHCSKWVEQRVGRTAIDHLYDMDIVVSEKHSTTSCISAITFPGKELLEIAKSPTIESRFMRDGRLCHKASDRYVRWLKDHRAYVPVEAPVGAFLVPVTDDDGARRISLIAVDPNLRGRGIGTRLVKGVFSAEPNNKIWRVKVSARNRKAMRFYETIGFRVKSISTVFHVWV